MEFNSAQNKFIQDLRQNLSIYQSNSDPKLKAPATNLEWNLKKITGEYTGEAIDGATFAQRTKQDLELIVSALPAGTPGQDFASNAIADIDGIFGAGGAGGGASAATASAAAGTGAAASAAGGVGSATTVDVKGMLAEKAENSGEDLAWKTSVVDLLKLLGKDSSQGARRRYAVALGFPEQQIGNMPSAEFNTWLHGQLLSTLAHNGGNLPSNIA